ncbi:MAG: hypothetical protein WC292_03985 [Clostridia bacterium]
MVTLRRDVAAGAKNRVFDRVGRDSALTDYDIFMEQKQKNEKRSNYFCGTCAIEDEPILPERPTSCMTMENALAANYNYFGQPICEKEEAKPLGSYVDYSEYIKAQLHRTSPQKLLTKEEFYAERFEAEKGRKLKTETKKSARAVKPNKKLSKSGKIFIAFYVLAVAVIASIILVVNGSVVPDVVDASVRGSQDKVDALVIEEPQGETNWFDKLLDVVNNG